MNDDGDRLIAHRSPGGRALAAFDATTARDLPGAEERAWRALQPRLKPRRAWSALAAWATASLLASAATAFLLWSSPARRAAVPVALTPAPRARQSPPRDRFVAAPVTATTEVDPRPPTRPTPTAAAPAGPPPLVLSSSPRPLFSGPHRLDDHILLSVAPGTRAEASQHRGTTRLVLRAGTVKLSVAAHQPDHRLSVQAGPYRFVDRGTVFRVARQGSDVDLWVGEGRIAVWRADRLLATVSAGGHWSTPPAAEREPPPSAPAPAAPLRVPAGDPPAAQLGPTAAPMPASPPASPPSATPPPLAEGPAPSSPTPAAPAAITAPPAPAPVLAALSSRAEVPARAADPAPGIGSCETVAARGNTAGALTCYRRLAAGEPLTAEAALYQEARLRGERLGDLPGALATLLEHRRRFPHGALRVEVDVTLVELLPRLGRYRQALDESAALLARQPRHERAAELRLLRGNILRESFHDYALAEIEYAAARHDGAAADGSAVTDDAAFFQAVCLEASNRGDAATAAYRRYLAGRAPRHAAEARTRLSALEAVKVAAPAGSKPP